MNAAAILLSGGKSSRMGTNKALLKINEKTNIERIRDILAEHFAETILVTNDPAAYQFLGVKMASDHYPGMGPLAGLHAGLEASSHEVNVLVACDMPFVSGELAAAMAEKCGEYDAVIPVIGGKQHPLFAVFKRSAAEEAAKCIKAGNLRMKHLLDRLNVLYLTETELGSFNQLDLDRVFFNMNHPNEYEDAKNWAKS
ncbi:molybdenum cofactor guanylyltransferase [Neobacillus niacini]|uniref:molybdenum cofactor guanylyltransferase n=1 Tax=Neobacillus niacini TaxID=86668 RepID=UPI0021CB0CC0|nr:molybdenum cofactor guanylyltransferase [Neobacillus niacini]MCM3764094.1 molybdenum cofactor guanylyltransferase [Neobacillus niacini]